MRIPLDNFVITSHYGERTLKGKKQFHDGLDLISRESNRVFAPTECVCSYDMDNYQEALRWIDKHHSGGNMIIMDFTFRGVLYHMRFLHLIDNLVRSGRVAIEGQLIGHYGDVGISYGAHLHNDLYDAMWKKLNIEEFYQEAGLL